MQRTPTVTLIEFLRFASVGGFCFLLGMSLLYGFTDGLGLHYLWSMVLALVIVNIVGWCLHRLWTFRSTSTGALKELARYMFVNLASAPLTLLLMAILTSSLHVQYLVSGVLVSVAMMLVNFAIHKTWSFRQKRTHSGKTGDFS
jgi:putative flippase GtrA